MITALKKLTEHAFSHTMKKDYVLNEIDMIKKSVRDELLPSLEITLRGIDGVDVSFAQTEVTMIAKALKLPNTTTPKMLIEELTKFVKEIDSNFDKLEAIVDSDVPDYITDKTITARVGGILGTVTNFSSIILYLSDLVLYLIYKFSNTPMYYKMKEKQVRFMLGDFSNMYKKYRGNIKTTLKDINKLSDTEIGDIETFVLGASRNDKKFNLPVNGFIGNPIYYFRMWLVDLEISRYEYLKDKKKLVELKLMDMKMNAQGQPDPKLQKKIEYYEEKLAKIEYKISKIEDK